jgi:hypothetical protein
MTGGDAELDAGAIVAIYAAVVATGSVGWQVYAWRHSRATRVEVKAQMALLGMTGGGSIEAISITAINQGENPIVVRGAGIDSQDGSGSAMHVIQPPPGADLPGEVAPRSSGMTYVLKAEAERQGLDVFKPVTAWVRLATGEVIKSKPLPLMRQ